MLGILLVLQVASPACTPAALCRLLEQAEAANRRTTLAGGGYQATMESEHATLSRREWRIEAPTLLEQTAGMVRWSESGYDYRLIGSRGFTNGIPLSSLHFLRIGWVIPTLAGSRLQLISESGTTSHVQTLSGALAPAIIVHPLAEDRESFYRFAGGEPARRQIDGTEREVLVIDVAIRPDLTQEEMLFEGELDLDPGSHAVVRMRGEFRVVGRPKRGMHLMDFEPSATLVDLVNRQLADGNWVPQMQRFEVQNASSHKTGYAGIRRIISRYYDLVPLSARPGGNGIGASTMGYALSSAPDDSVRSYRGWHAHPGHFAETVSDDDFGRFGPDRLRLSGRPRVMLQGAGHGDFLRVNRIEGVFTGIAFTARLRDAAPGVFLKATGGYAWSEKVARGGGSAGWETPAWTLEAGGARTLDVTNKFRNQFDNPAFAGLFGRDSWDYVERTGGFAAVTRALDLVNGSTFRLEFARMTDDVVSRHKNKSLLGRKFRVNRNSAPGTYWRSRAVFDWNPEVSPLFTHDGVGLRAEAEHGSGDLDYTRIEARLVLRKTLSKMFFLAKLHGGTVLGDAPPPQQLFELGGPAGLPGYDYKEFAGTRAALMRVRLTAPLGVLDRPHHLGRSLVFPSLSPAISVGFQSGYANAKSAGGLAAVRALGDKFDEKTGDPVFDENGDPLPASVASSKLHHAVDVRIGFFGDALAAGIAKPLEKGRKLRFIFAFGRQF